jgi:hypothetical protein
MRMPAYALRRRRRDHRGSIYFRSYASNWVEKNVNFLILYNRGGGGRGGGSGVGGVMPDHQPLSNSTNPIPTAVGTEASKNYNPLSRRTNFQTLRAGGGLQISKVLF